MFNYLRNISSPNVSPLNNIQSIGDILGIFLNVLMGSGFAIAIATIGYSFIMYILSAGDPKATQTAWHAFIWGVIAAAISLGALGIKLAVVNTLGVNNPNIINELPSF